MNRSPLAWVRRAGVELASGHGIVLILVASLTVNVVQARQLGESRRAKSVASLNVGASVPALRVRTSADASVDVSFGSLGKPTIVYYFSPTCKWCERNWKNIAALAEGTRDRYQFVAVTASDTTGFLPERVGLHADVYGRITDAQRRALRLGGTPQMLVVSPEGRILASWVGAFGARLEPQIERYFGVRLPGLMPR